MPRKPRVFGEGLVYHVHNRVGRGEEPFARDEEVREFLNLLREVAKRDGLAVLAWCVMPDGYDLALRAASVPLWRSIRSVQHRYSQASNQRQGVSGALWQARYEARPVSGRESLRRLVAYVHLRPVAGMVVVDPVRYRWSGHRELIHLAKDALIDVDEALALFGATRKEAVRIYRSFVGSERTAPWIAAPLRALPWWKAAPAGERAASGGAGVLAATRGPARRKLTAEEFLKRVCPLVGVPVRDLASPRRAPGLVDARELIGGLGVERWGIAVKALAEALGKSREGVSHWVRRAARRRSNEPEFAARLETLDRRLARSR
jgi:REP-associated tyrosine transposase